MTSRTILDYLDDDVLANICSTLYDLGPKSTFDSTGCPATFGAKNSITSLSLTCKRFRAHCLAYVFQVFILYCHGDNPWDRAMKKLEGWNPEYSPYVREVHIHLELGYKEDPEPFINELPSALANTLSTMSTSRRLDRLTLIINENRAPLFGNAFAQANFSLPSVKRLLVGPYNEYAINHCPNVECISVNGFVWLHSRKGGQEREHSLNLMQCASTLSNLKCFMMREYWNEKLLIALHEAIPTIKILVLPCGLRGIRFEDFVVHLSRFRQVETLSIPDASQLGIGFTPPRCGNIYRGPRGAEIHKNVQRQRKEAQEHAASVIFDKCPWLKELWFDTNTRVTMKRRDGLRDSEKGELEWYGNEGRGYREDPFTWLSL
ncbi:hypothetical protein VKT23_009803 [Stygiomarasmius scandens]|uniref:F-box domain-containing protein n=1 Tax=Marasmiellus scandens TaxID=2682957 RepID=A0ABR1JG41_9AGAR